MSDQTHIIVVLLENEFGALSRVANLFSARGFNIETLNVAPTLDPTLSRMTITSVGSERVLEQIIKQLNKLIDVVEAYSCTPGEHCTREHALLRLRASDGIAASLEEWRVNERVDASILSDGGGELIVSLSTDTFSLERLLESLDSSEVLEISRSGALAVHNSPGEDSPLID